MESLEIERKWLVMKPIMLIPSRYFNSTTWYLDADSDVRVIKKVDMLNNVVYKYTCKSPGDLIRKEDESYITEDIFNELIAALPDNVQANPLLRTSFVYEVDGHELYVATVDKYRPTEFQYAEIEFDSAMKAKEFVLPSIIQAKDVTYDPYYKMKNYWKRTRL